MSKGGGGREKRLGKREKKGRKEGEEREWEGIVTCIVNSCFERKS